jgi:itaconate CoA-transferase
VAWISVTGTPETPSRVGVSAADITTGMYAFSAVLAALVRRGRTGRGAHVRVAMLDALAEWMTYPMYRHAYGGSTMPRVSTSHPALAPYGTHATKDGEVIFGLQNEREWVVFCDRVLGQPEVANDPRFGGNPQRAANREALTAIIEGFFADKTTAEVVAILDRAGIANGRLNSAKDVWEHEQLAARDRWRTIGTPAGDVRALLPAIDFADVEAVMGDVPALGAHTDAVLEELGFAAGDIAALRADGAV